MPISLTMTSDVIDDGDGDRVVTVIVIVIGT